ncbi:MAG TPA: hypothetical protein VMR90_12880 [Candidatus Cybelea sp.]|nr:hypothetical protein [Candidatus Cybelea sp.]
MACRSNHDYSEHAPAPQRELFSAALQPIGARDLTNTVIEVKYAGNRMVGTEYARPETDEEDKG